MSYLRLPLGEYLYSLCLNFQWLEPTLLVRVYELYVCSDFMFKTPCTVCSFTQKKNLELLFRTDE